MVDEFGAGMHVVVRKNMGMVYSDESGGRVLDWYTVVGSGMGWCTMVGRSMGLVYFGGKYLWVSRIFRPGNHCWSRWPLSGWYTG
jgi:hypothetical protein